MKRRSLLLGSAIAAAALSFAAPTPAQTKWDLPAGYPAGNPHTQNLTQFAADVQKATNGQWYRCAGDDAWDDSTANDPLCTEKHPLP